MVIQAGFDSKALESCSFVVIIALGSFSQRDPIILPFALLLFYDTLFLTIEQVYLLIKFTAECRDKDTFCYYWERSGFCSKDSIHYPYMKKYCEMTCKICKAQGNV